MGAGAILLGVVACGSKGPSAKDPFASIAPKETPKLQSGLSPGGLYYEISGRGTDWVVLVHGFGVDLRMWDPQMKALDARFRVMRYDLPDMGKSLMRSAARPGWQDLADLMDQLGIAKANLVGLSAGSNIAVDFAVVSPERVERLVLASPNIDGYVPKENMMTWFGPIVAEARAGRPDSAAALFARTPLVKLYGDTAAQKTVTKLITDNARVWTDTLRPPGPPLTPPALKRLDAITSPVLVIVGAHDAADTKAIADTIVASVKRGTLLVFGNAGHVLNIDQPVRFDSALVGFLGPTGTP